MTTVKQMKCACAACSCMVDLSTAITKEGKGYCSQTCADGHVDGKGCGCGGCDCH